MLKLALRFVKWLFADDSPKNAQEEMLRFFEESPVRSSDELKAKWPKSWKTHLHKLRKKGAKITTFPYHEHVFTERGWRFVEKANYCFEGW